MHCWFNHIKLGQRWYDSLILKDHIKNIGFKKVGRKQETDGTRPQNWASSSFNRSY